MVNSQKCWFTTIRQVDAPRASTHTLNAEILDLQKNMPQSKSTDIITSLRINDDEQMKNVMQGSVSLQHRTGIASEHDLTPEQSYLINQTIGTIQKLNAMGAAYLIQPQLDQLKQVPQTEHHANHNVEQNMFAARFGQQNWQQMGSSLMGGHQYSLPPYPGRDDSRKKRRQTREKRRQKYD